jgi:hypothetical protein
MILFIRHLVGEKIADFAITFFQMIKEKNTEGIGLCIVRLFMVDVVLKSEAIPKKKQLLLGIEDQSKERISWFISYCFCMLFQQLSMQSLSILRSERLD